MGTSGFLTECADCGKLFPQKNPNQKRCAECQKRHNLKMQAEYYALRREQKEAAERKKKNICRKTKSCVYGGRFNNAGCCDYILITGKKRPCPAGDCKVYRTGKKARQIKRISV